MQYDDKIDLSQLNKKSLPKKPGLLSKLPKLSFKTNDGINRDNQGKFASTSGSGGLGFTKKLDLKRMLPVVLVVALVGGFMVFRSFATTGDNAPSSNGKLLLLDTSRKRFPNYPSNYIPKSYLANYSDESGEVDFGASIGVLDSYALPFIGAGSDKYYSSGDSIDNKRFAFTSDGRYVVKVSTDSSTYPRKVKIYKYSIDGQELKVLKESAEWYSSGESGCYSDQGCINDRTKLLVVGNRILYETTKRLKQGFPEYDAKIYTMNLDGSDSRVLDAEGGRYQKLYAVDQYKSKVIYSTDYELRESNSDGTAIRPTVRSELPVGKKGVLLRYNGGDTSPSPGGSIEVQSNCLQNAVAYWGMPAETECKDKGSAYNNPENLVHIAYNYANNNEIKSIFTNNDLRSMAGIPFSSGGRINMMDFDSFNWSPGGMYMTANFVSYAYNPSTGAQTNPQPSASIIFDPFSKKLVKKISADNIEIYAWQPIATPEDKRDPTCTLEIASLPAGYTATWTSTAPATWTTRLFNSANNTTIPNLPLNGSQVVVPKVNTLNTYSLYFNDPANPASTVGCSAELDLNKAFPTEPSNSAPPQQKRTPSR